MKDLDLVREMIKLERAEMKLNKKHKRMITQENGCYMIEKMEEAIMNALKNGEDVHLHGFLQFTTKELPQRERKNPQNCTEKLIKPAVKRVVVKQMRALANLFEIRQYDGRAVNKYKKFGELPPQSEEL